jgi:hypothetical protein
MTIRASYLRMSGRLPKSWRTHLESLPLHVFRWQHERQCRQAWRSGPPYRPSHKCILIDITFACNLGCVDCNRSLGSVQAPSTEQMTPDQIRRFVAESIEQRRLWEGIQIEGGEPTLHPQLEEILDILNEYRRKCLPSAWIQINTNGLSDSSSQVLSHLPAGIDVYSSNKKGPFQELHCAFNVAPIDLPEYADVDFSQGCFQPAKYGLGLNRYGYYPHPACGSIDRVFGFDIGRKTLPRVQDDLRDQFAQLCGYCGCFRTFSRRAQAEYSLDPSPEERARRGQVTTSWREAYRRYREMPPSLSLY